MNEKPGPCTVLLDARQIAESRSCQCRQGSETRSQIRIISTQGTHLKRNHSYGFLPATSFHTLRLGAERAHRLSLTASHLGPRAGMEERINGNWCDSLLPLLKGSLSFPGHPLPPQPVHSPNIHMAMQRLGPFSPEHRFMLD